MIYLIFVPQYWKKLGYPIHFDEIKNIKFNKKASNNINNQLDQQDMLLNSLTVDKTYWIIYMKNI